MSYAALLTSLILVRPIEGLLFLEPSNIPIANWIRDFAAIIITTFYSGYAVLRLSGNKRVLSITATMLLSYIIGFSLTSVIAFTTLSLGYTVQVSVFGIIGLNLFLLVFMVIFLARDKFSQRINAKKTDFVFRVNYFGFFLILLVVCLIAAHSYMYGPQIISDQRTHHGIALLFNSGFPNINGVLTPPIHYFFHIYLSSLFFLSGIPSMNAYSSLAILNILPLIAFYLMVKHICRNAFSAIVSTFFAFLTSGFGWVYAMNIGSSDLSSYTYNAWLKTYDILTPISTVVAGHPDVTTPLQLTALLAVPILFLLIYAPNIERLGSIRYALVFGVTFFSYMGHSEASLYIAVVLLTLPFLRNGWRLGVGISAALFTIYIMDFIAPARYYTIYPQVRLAAITTSMLSLLTGLSVAFTLIALTATRFNKKNLLRNVLTRFPKKLYAIIITIISSIAVFSYLLSFIVWGSVLPKFNTWLTFGVDGSVPWYFYPLKLGIVGTIALVGSLYLLASRKFHTIKMLVPFYLLAILSYVLSPYYLEYRLIKHMYIALSVIAGFTVATTVYELVKGKIRISFFSRSGQRCITFGGRQAAATLLIGIIILSIPSTLLFIQTEKNLTNENIETSYSPFISSVLPRRTPFTSEEIQALEFIRNNIDPKNEAALSFPRGPLNQYSELVELSGAWIVQTNRFIPFLEVSRAENFFDLTQKIQPKYIYLNWKDIQQLFSDAKYSTSYLKEALNFFPIAYNNSKVTIFEVPRLAPPSSQSTVGVLSDTPNSYLTAIAMAGINYTIVNMDDYKQLGIETLIMTRFPEDTIFDQLSSWVSEGKQLIIMDLPRQKEPVYEVINGNISNLHSASNFTLVENESLLVQTRGKILFEKELEDHYTLLGKVDVQKTLDSDNHIGIVFNYQDAENYYYFFVRSNKAVLYKMQDGTGEEVWIANFIREGSSNIEIEANQQILSFSINGKFLGQYNDSIPLTRGLVGYQWYNLIGKLDELSTQKVFVDIPADGLSGNYLDLNLTSIYVPHIAASDLPIGAIVNAYYTKNNEKSSLFSFSVPNGEGQIKYVSLSSLLKNSRAIENFSQIFDIAGINLPKARISEQATDLSEPINYVKGSSNLSGSIVVESPSIISLSDDVSIKINGDSINNSTVIPLISHSVGGTIASTSATILFNESGVYSIMDISTPATIHINGSFETKEYSINASSNIELLSESGIVRVRVKTPKICINGDVQFQDAYISSRRGESVAYGRPVTISGQTEFDFVNMDNGIMRLSDLTLEGEVKLQSSERFWNEWDIQWGELILAYPHWFLFAVIVTTLVTIMVLKITKIKFKFRVPLHYNILNQSH